MRSLILSIIFLIGLSQTFYGQQYTYGQPVTGQSISQGYYHESEVVIRPNFSSAPGFSVTIQPFSGILLTEHNKPAIISHKIKSSGVNTTDMVRYLNIDKLVRTYTFLDAFGRNGQEVVKDFSSTGVDLVQPYSYEKSFSSRKSYLPYTTTSYNGNSYRQNALVGSSGYADSEQRQYYLSPPQNVTGAGTNGNAFSEVRTEDFGGRPLEQALAGEHHKLGSGHTHTTAYNFNAGDELGQWTYDGANNMLVLSGGFAENSLYRTVSIDGDGQESITYKDTEGKLVATRQKINDAYIVTYYLYDAFNRLAFVIPPFPAEVSVPISETDDLFKNFIYAYRYDARGRQTHKHVPGAGWTEIVYNRRDNVVLTQNAVQKGQNKWGFTKYDANDRPVYSGIYNSADSRETLQTEANTHNGSLYEDATPSLGMGYSDTSFPIIGGANNKVYIVEYYDDYTFLANGNINSQTDAGIFVVPQADTIMKVPSGLITGRLVNVLGTDDYLLQLIHYDEDLNVVKTAVQHYYGKKKDAGNYEENTTLYDFTGEPVKETKIHAIKKTTGTVLTNIETFYAYDHTGRLKQLSQKYNGGSPVILENYVYNELGELITQKLHSANGTDYLQHIDYRYTINGQLRSINNPGTLADENDVNKTDAFAMKLWYEDTANGSATPKYNGKISGVTWQTKVPSSLDGHMPQEPKTFTYEYDQLGRLTDGRFESASLSNAFREQATYDGLGNIQTMVRKNKQGSEQHNLSYNYIHTGVRSNKLADVTDTGTQGISSTYGYDANGNLISDSRKLITGIAYNDYGLIDEVQFSDNRLLKYHYDADGNKLQADVTVGGIVTSRYYVEDFEYNHNGDLEFCWTPSGRAVPNGTGFSLEYFINDQNGNLRAIIWDRNSNAQLDEDEIFDLRDYYPFGSRLSYGITVPPPSILNGYGFGGKELQGETALLDFHARWYDPLLGRWTGADPLAEMEYSLTLYRYGFNDPINFTDPTGLWEGGDPGNGRDYLYDANDEIFLYGDNLKEVEIMGKRPGVWDRLSYRTEHNLPLHFFSGTNKIDHQALAFLNNYQLHGAWGHNNPFQNAIVATVELTVGGGGAIKGVKLTGKATIKLLKLIVKRRGFSSFNAFKKAYGSAGKGNAWHHIVEQGGNNVSRFGAKAIHNTNNIIKLPHGAGSIHAKVSGYYSSKQAFTGGQTVRQWLSTQSYQQQYDFGIKILKQFGWMP